MSDYFRGNACLNHSQKETVIRRCGFRCNHCKKYLKNHNVEFDHIIPLRVSGNNNIGNYQSLCRNCHIKKTKYDKRLINEVKNSFNKKLCRIYQFKNGNQIAIILCDKGYTGEEIRIKIDDYDSFSQYYNEIMQEYENHRIYCIRTGKLISQ